MCSKTSCIVALAFDIDSIGPVRLTLYPAATIAGVRLFGGPYRGWRDFVHSQVAC